MAHGWMVRASKNGVLFDEFARGYVGIGWLLLGDLSDYDTQENLLAAIEEHYPDAADQKRAGAASMLWRFAHEIQSGDTVITYNPKMQYYLVGRDKGQYCHATGVIEKYPNTREVEWIGQVNKSALLPETQRSLSAMISLFSFDETVEKELMALLIPIEETTQQFGLF
jgi:restriction system protein